MFWSRESVAAVSPPTDAQPVLRLVGMAVVAMLAALALVVTGTGRAAADVSTCQFVLGFSELQAMAPDTVGDCLKNENHDPRDGITRQVTTRGVLLWDKATNWTAFTDGPRTWVNGPTGLQERLSIERFDWEPASIAAEATVAADALTRAYVEQAIAYYAANGREATIEYYSLITEDRAVPSLGPDRRYLFLVDRETYVLLASPIHYLNNQVMGLIAPGGPFHAEVAKADENGVWVQSLRPNPSTGQQEPARYFIILHDGLLFMSAHQIIQENAEVATKEYVNKAIGFYRQYGLLATESYYNSPASVEGPLYLFMTDENDIYIVHPIEPERVGTDIKEVTDGAGDPLGQRIAQATEEGVWVEYYWPHPVTGEKELKTTWAIRHDGKIFASGYYTASPAWAGEDPWEFTQDYVGRAIERYNNDGLESMQNYYNSVVSFEGQWYLFATDENDRYIVHPVFPNLIGTDIKALTGKDSEGNPLGESLAKAADGGEGTRVEYQWPHPITLVEAPKIAYAVRHNGVLFASGYYPLPEDPRTYTQDYVAEAIAYYENHGLAATVDYYRSKESVAEGVWFLALLDKDGKFLTHYVNDGLVGTHAEDYWSPDGTDVGRRMLASTEEGHWFQATFPNIRGAGDNHRITWAVRHDGLVFASGYFAAPTDIPATPKGGD